MGSLALLPAPPLPDLLAQFRTPTPAGGPGGGGHFTHQGFEAGRRGLELNLLESACHHPDRLLPVPRLRPPHYPTPSREESPLRR